MKIYFSASVSNMDESTKARYEKIVSIIEGLGHKVISSQILDTDPGFATQQSEKKAQEVQRKLTKWKKQANMVVVDATHPSLGVGQEIMLTLMSNKPVIALYLEGHEPHILEDQGKDLLLLQPYTMDTLKQVVRDSIEYASERQDTRFNFFVSPKHQNYMDYVSKTRKLPRAVFLRRLIEQRMESDEEYQQS